jgi:hypothetical protein
MNFLEEFIAEWYEYQGYFVRKNIKARKRLKGGYDAELDVLAYSPSKKQLIHIEVSGDALSWSKREKIFREKKFIITKKEYEQILGSKIDDVKKIAVLAYQTSTRVDLDWAGIEVILIPSFIKMVCAKLKKKDFLRDAVPEGYPILRSMQLVLNYGIET